LEVVSELIELSSVIADIYDAAIDPALWQRALASICAYISAPSAVLYWHDAATERSEALHLFNEVPEYTRLYFEKYLPMNPMFPAAAFIDAGVVATTEDIMPRSELVKTRFYKEWIKPQGIEDALSVNLEKGVTRVSMINVRTNVVPDEAMRARLAVLVPHLQRAVTIGRLFAQSKAKEEALTETLDQVEAAVFLVGAQGAISFANDPARKMLDEATLVREDGDALHALAPDTDRILHDIFAAARRGDASLGVRGVAVPLASASPDPWFAHVLPLTSGRRQQAGHDLTAVAAVFIRQTAPNAPPPLEAIARQYSLLPSEVRVLAAVAKVQGVKQLANFLGVSQATVKTHLHNLFRKTGARRQSELVKLVAGI
jgi:DNA-binding CsgD family transcriptional regulator/PAS domain-containing protein